MMSARCRSDRPAAPARVGQLVPDPVQVLGRQPESGREPQPARTPGSPGSLAIVAPGTAQPARLVASWQMTAPAGTVWPTWTARPVTVPALCAVSGCSIFIASSTTMVSPVATCCAVGRDDLDDRALHRADQLVSRRPPRRPRRRRRAARRALGAWPPAPRHRPLTAARPDRPPGTVTSSRLPPTSTVIRSRSAGLGRHQQRRRRTAGCRRRTRSRSTGCAPRIGPWRKPDRRTTARWNGSTVGMPSISNSASARRERSSACARVAPGDDQLGDQRVEGLRHGHPAVVRRHPAARPGRTAAASW